jgi:hypothetical protein
MPSAPSIGNRIPVKLPWKGVTDNKDQFTSIKQPVAKFLKFDQATEKELEYTTKVSIKDSSGEKTSGKKEVKRRRRPGYRQRSIKLTFQMGRAASAGRKSTLTGKKIKIGANSYASINFPITKSVGISDVIQYFERGPGAGLGVLKVTDVNSGQSYPILRK